MLAGWPSIYFAPFSPVTCWYRKLTIYLIFCQISVIVLYKIFLRIWDWDCWVLETSNRYVKVRQVMDSLIRRIPSLFINSHFAPVDQKLPLFSQLTLSVISSHEVNPRCYEQCAPSFTSCCELILSQNSVFQTSGCSACCYRINSQ